MMSDWFPVQKCSTVALGATLVGLSGIFFLPAKGTPFPTYEVAVEISPQHLTPRQRHLLEAALQSAERRDSSYSQLRDFLAIANAYQKLGDDIKASALLERAIQLNQSSKNSIDIDLRLARNSIALGEFDQADQLLQQVLSTPSSPVRPDSLADIAGLYSLFPEVDLIQNRLDSVYTLIPTQLEDPFRNFGVILRGIATAYRHLEDAEVVTSGAARLSKLASSQLLSVYPKPSSSTHFFDHPASFFKLSESDIDQQGGLFLSDMVTTYAFLYGDIANLYRIVARLKNISKGL